MSFPFVAPVKGVSFHQDVVCAVEVGTPVEVVAEPENEFDANACAVRAGGETLGHLPREIAGRMRADGDLCWSAEVAEVLRGSKATGLRIRVIAPCSPLAAACRPMSTERVTDEPDASAEAGAPADAQGPEVFARSGRRLGRFVDALDGSVRVKTDDDRLVSYPETLVLLRD